MESRKTLPLLQWQRQFKRAVKGQGALPTRLGIEGAPGATSSERMEVYRYAFWARLEQSLTEDFPGMRRSLGGRRFQGFVRQFIKRSPSTKPSIADYSAKFLERIRCSRRIQKAHRDRAERDWQRLVLSLAREPILDEAIVAVEVGTSPGNLRLSLVEVRSSYQDDTGRVFFAWRDRGEVLERRISRSELALIQSLRKSLSLEELATGLSLPPEVARRAIARLVKLGIVRIERSRRSIHESLHRAS